MAEGHHPDSEETLRRMEIARMGVLHDEKLFDAPLSVLGRQEAQMAHENLQTLIREHQLPPPKEVLVSPLTRTLETANLVFPDSQNIRVREELRERCTGKPPDTRSSSYVLRSRPCFKRFSMNRLQIQSKVNLSQLLEEVNLEEAISPRTHRSCSVDSTFSGTEEDKSMLRERTRQLFDLLAESEERSIAVITHKGYLRELERGQFGKPLSREFQNCEVRVYRIHIDLSSECNQLLHTERLV